jgi:hypothetical protein
VNALKACRLLHAFVTVRTDCYWLYSGFPPNVDRPELNEWQEVDPDRKLARVVGTHFSALIPLDLKPAGDR